MDGEERVRVGVLGPLRVHGTDGTEITPEGELGRRLLALLVLRRGSVVAADVAVDALWPRQAPRDPLAALQTHVFRLRRLLPADAITSVGSGYRLEPWSVVVDADRLVEVVHLAVGEGPGDPERTAGAVDEVLATWRGSPYPELADLDEGRLEAGRLDDLRVRAVEERAGAALATGRAAEVVAAVAALVDEQPLRERPRELLMSALAATGRTVDALRVYDDFRRLIGDELGIEPSPSLAGLHDDLVRGHLAPAATRSRLPVAVTSLIGRDELVAAALSMAGECRLVTLLGPGGVGKTRLATEVGRRLAVERADRPVVMCELSAATGDTAMDAVGAALGIDRRVGADPIERIVAVIDELVLVLDNCEHVLEPMAELAERLLEACPAVTVIATSRERLRVRGEQLCPVAPLPLTDEQGPAVALFVDRAGAVVPGFAPGPSELACIAEIVRHLDGLPLAIELAAARLHTLQLDEIARGLDRRFRLLAAGPRSASRHRSLGAAVAWSYDLLDRPLQEVFADLAAFITPFTVDDAAAVAAIDAVDAADALSALTERSLIGRTADGRYVMLETLREYGRERLAADGRLEENSRRHAHHMVARSEAAELRIRLPDPGRVLQEVDDDIAELRAALAWLIAEGDIERAGRLVVSLEQYGFLRLRPDVLVWAEAVTEADPDDESPHAASVWATGSSAAWMAGDVDETGVRANRALAIAEREGGPTPGLIAHAVGSHALYEGRMDDAIYWYKLARVAPDAAGATAIIAGGTEVLALAYAADPRASVAARQLLDEVADSRNGYAAFAWYSAGEAELSGNPELARQRFERALELAESSGASFVTGIAGTSIASIEARTGDPSAAAEQYRELIGHWRRAGMWSTQWTMLRSIAILLDRLGRSHDAAVLLGAALSTSFGHRLFGEDAAALAALGTRLRAELGDDDYAAACAEGAVLDGDAAVEHALRSL